MLQIFVRCLRGSVKYSGARAVKKAESPERASNSLIKAVGFAISQLPTTFTVHSSIAALKPAVQDPLETIRIENAVLNDYALYSCPLQLAANNQQLFLIGILMVPLYRYLGLALPQLSTATNIRTFSLSNVCSYIQKLTRVRVVDNSALGNTPYHRPPKCIHVYTKNGVGKVGDRILLAIKGEKKKALIVGCKFPGPRMTPRFDSNNVVLIEDNGNPVGTRIKTPIPSLLRKKKEFSKVLAIATDFV